MGDFADDMEAKAWDMHDFPHDYEIEEDNLSTEEPKES